MGDIALTASQRSSLLSLQGTQSLSERTQARLSSGKSINSVVDDAVKFFKAKGLSDRASDFSLKKDDIAQGISSLNTALQAIESLDSLVKQMKGVVEAAKSQSTDERKAATTQFEEIGKQIFQLIEDASYNGVNLLNSTSSELKVSFGIRTNSFLDIDGVGLNSTTATAVAATASLFTVATFSAGGLNLNLSVFNLSGSGSFTSFGTNNSNTSYATTTIQILDGGISRLRSQASTLGGNVAILQTRLDFTSVYTNELEAGADKLTLADLNEEGANLVALQTRQQLGIQSLSIAGQQQQAVLQLIQ